MNKNKNPLKNQKGFTLIEIIAVLVILGILAAVAIPKYFDLQVDAAKASLKSAVAELNARENLSWAKHMSDKSVALLTKEEVIADFGDFSVNDADELSSANSSISLQVFRQAPTGSAPGLWTFDDETGWIGI